jgi:hypothetical protein
MLDTRAALSNDSAFPGIVVLQPTAEKHMYQPSKDHETIVRVYPEPFDDGSGFFPYRHSADINHFTNWLAVDYVARYVGSEQRITFITRCLNQDPNTSEMLWDRLVRIVIRSIDNDHPEWGSLIRGKTGLGAAIPGQTMRQAKAKIHAFVQGILLKHKGNSYRKQPKPNVVVMLPPTARISLQNMCNKQINGWRGDEDDYISRFECGDWLDPAEGRELIIKFRKSKANDDDSVEVNFDTTRAAGVAPPADTAGGAFANAYDVELAGYKTPIPGDLINQYYKPWDKVLRYLNEQEQVELMCSAFKPDVVKAAFGGMGLLPKSVEFGRTTSAPAATEQPAKRSAPPSNAAPKPAVSTTISSVENTVDFSNLDNSAPTPVDEPPFDMPEQPTINISDPGSTQINQDAMRAKLAAARRQIRNS